MKRETWKVFLACAIGAGIGSLVALETAHAFWWVGLLVGGLCGYLTYDFCAVLRAVPHAARAAYGGGSATMTWLIDCLRLMRNWFVTKEHPFFFVGALLAALWAKPAWSIHQQILELDPPSVTSFVTALISWISWSGLMGFFTLWPVMLFTWLGARFVEKKFWPGTDDIYGRQRRYELEARGYTLTPLSYANMLRWFAKGVGVAVWLFVWAIPVTILAGLVWVVRFLRSFAWELFLRIHSEMRLLCGIDAMLGVAVGYFAGSAIIGAFAGGIFGVLNYVVITERWLRRKGYLPIR